MSTEGHIRGHVGPPPGPTPEVTDPRIVPASGRDAEQGVLAFASCRYAGLRIDGLTVRRRPDGVVVVAFPTRRDRRGRRHNVVVPEDAGTRETIERAIFAAYREAAP